MSGRNVDFFAVLMISLALIGFSKVSSIWQLPDALDSIRIENAIHTESCPFTGEIVSRLSRILQP
jgi:hypothetical protein